MEGHETARRMAVLFVSLLHSGIANAKKGGRALALFPRFIPHPAHRILDLTASVALWFLLPVTIWLTVGWIGLLLYWRLFFGAELMDKDGPARRQKHHALSFGEGETSCSIAESQAQ